MHSDLPKVLQPLAGRPLLAHVLDAAKALEPALIHVVYGHGGERVARRCARRALRWVLQAEQLGTGHAVQQAMPGDSGRPRCWCSTATCRWCAPRRCASCSALAGPRTWRC